MISNQKALQLLRLFLPLLANSFAVVAAQVTVNKGGDAFAITTPSYPEASPRLAYGALHDMPKVSP